MNLSLEKKIAGVLAPLFALRSENDLGIGDLKALRQFIDWSAAIGFRLVQMLPINEVGGDNSPYNAISAHALEPTTLHLAPGSPADLMGEDFDEVVAKFNLPKLRKGAVKYARVRKLKMQLLEKSFVRFCERIPDDSSAQLFAEFCRQESAWLDDYALFRALMQKNRQRETWDRWPEEQRSPETARAWLAAQEPKARTRFQSREKFYRYVQWIARMQWSAVKNYAEERGVALMGDIPFGVSYYSADVFARREQFSLAWSGGAPPEPYFKDDEFTQKWGQNWGIPLYRWNVMREKNFDWWRERVRGVREIFHVFRIDHVLGFYRIYAFPWRPERNEDFLPLDWNQMLEKTDGHAPHFSPRDDSDWENSEANRRDGEEYLRAVLDESGDTRVVGEDLGTVPNYVRPNLQSLGIAGFKIPQWETHHDGRVIPGAEYQRLSVATYATHDHKPLRALWEAAFSNEEADAKQARQDLDKIAQFAGVDAPTVATEFLKEFYPAIMRALFTSEAWIAIVMITDLLARKDRFNVPGTAANSNWTRRLPMNVSELKSRRAKLFRSLLEQAGRI